MAFHLTLHRKGAENQPPVPFAEIDEELRNHFGMPQHPTNWLANWYNLIGFALALEKSWSEIRELFPDPQLLQIVDYLEEHFTPDSWQQP